MCRSHNIGRFLTYVFMHTSTGAGRHTAFAKAHAVCNCARLAKTRSIQVHVLLDNTVTVKPDTLITGSMQNTMHQEFCVTPSTSRQQLQFQADANPCVVFLDLQVPQECPKAVSDMVDACCSQQPSDRPTAQQIIYVIECSIADHPAGA